MMDFMTWEIVSGWRGKMVACQWSGGNTQAASRKPCFAREERRDRAEFILRRPVTVGDKGWGDSITVFEYSEVQEHPARNELYSAE